jgi:hypothetical protein
MSVPITTTIASRSTPETAVSGVSWAAIFVGAVAAAALSLVLFILGVGLGLSSVSPWSNMGASAEAIGISAVLWIAFTQFAASGIGGYLAGRLRTKWATLHTDEVYFRDTAHGFMAWSVASLAMAGLLASSLTGIVGTTAKVGASAAGAATAVATTGASELSSESSANGPIAYYVDMLYRKDSGQAGSSSGATYAASTHAEAARIFATDLKAGALPDNDRQYLASLVAADTGLSAQDSATRVTDTFNKTKAALDAAATATKQAADAARKATAHVSLWMFVSLMIGAFIASFAATIGGRRRDLFD